MTKRNYIIYDFTDNTPKFKHPKVADIINTGLLIAFGTFIALAVMEVVWGID